MRILQLHNHHSSKGGAMEVLAHERELLAGRGHEVEQYTTPAAEELDLSPVRAGLKAIWNIEACRDIDAVITRFAPDVVHVHTPFPLMSPAVFRTAHRRGVPTVATLHSFRYSCIAATCFRAGSTCEDCVGKLIKLDGIRHRCYHDSIGASAAMTVSLAVHRGIGTFRDSVDRFLPLTQFAKRMLSREGIHESKIRVKANSVPDPGEPTSPRTRNPYFAFAGRLIEVKGVRTLLDAWQRAETGEYTLQIAGDGALADLVKQRAATDSSIRYLGWLEEAATTELMAGAEAVIVPSEWYEGFPLVILRSLSVGTPVLVSSLENLSVEVLEDRSGWTFAVGDAQSLAGALGAVLTTHPSDLAATRERARESYVQRYSPTANLKALESVYHDVMAERGVSAGRARG